MSALIGVTQVVFDWAPLLAQGGGDDSQRWLIGWLFASGGVVAGLLFLMWLVLRYIPNDAVGVVEKLWSHGVPPHHRPP